MYSTSFFVFLKSRLNNHHVLGLSKTTGTNPNLYLPITQGKCFITGDSHVRGLSTELNTMLPKCIQAHSFFQPGAGYQEIAKTLAESPGLTQTTSGDAAVVICGTNDICVTDWTNIREGIDTLLNQFNKCALTCIIGIPLRFDNEKLNKHIVKLNTKIKFYIKSSTSAPIFFVDPTKFLKPHHYLLDGIHINRKGKQILCKKIKSILIDDNNRGAIPLPEDPTQGLQHHFLHKEVTSWEVEPITTMTSNSETDHHQTEQNDSIHSLECTFSFSAPPDQPRAIQTIQPSSNRRNRNADFPEQIIEIS